MAEDPWTALGAPPVQQQPQGAKASTRTLTPVDYDPFAGQQSSATLTPVDYDPWAALGAPPQKAKQQPPTDIADTVVRGLANAVPFANDAMALADTWASYTSLPGAPSQEGKSFGQRYSENLAKERGTLEQEESEHPVLSYGSQLAGALALPVPDDTITHALALAQRAI